MGACSKYIVSRSSMDSRDNKKRAYILNVFEAHSTSPFEWNDWSHSKFINRLTKGTH